MRKLMTKLFALVMVVAVVCSLVTVATVSVSAADENIELIGNEKAKGDMYGICKEGASKNKFSVVNVSDLKAGEIEYKGPSTTAYYAEIGNSQDRDGMGIDFNTNIDVSDVTDGKEGRFMIDMWLWIEDVKQLDVLVLRAFESQTYKNYVTLGKDKVECLGEYRLFNQTIGLDSLKNGWNHVKIALPTFGSTSNDYEKVAFENFRKGENKKTVCSIAIMNRAKNEKTPKKLGDYAIASMRITTLKQIKADYPEEYPDDEGEDANDLTAEDEVESETVLTKIAKKEIEKFVKVLENDGTIDVSAYDAACQDKVKAAAEEAGIEIADLGNGQWTVAGGKNDTTGGGSNMMLIIIIAAAGVLVVAGVVVVLLVVSKKKKAAATAAVVEAVKDEESDEDADDEE